MKDDELLRYSRQIMLPQFDIAGQERLLASRVLVVGLGGLGSPVALYLASAGVGSLVLVDDDTVDISNLQRQVAHTTARVGQSKVESAATAIGELNPGVKLKYLSHRLDEVELSALLNDIDLVVDCTDNFSARFLLNRTCVKAKVPLVSAAAIRMEGQISVFDPRNPDSPCYECLYSEGEDADLNCSENGVLAPMVGMVGTLQAIETIKILTCIGKSLCGRLLLIDGLTMEFREMKLGKRADCPVCGTDDR